MEEVKNKTKKILVENSQKVSELAWSDTLFYIECHFQLKLETKDATEEWFKMITEFTTYLIKYPHCGVFSWNVIPHPTFKRTFIFICIFESGTSYFSHIGKVIEMRDLYMKILSPSMGEFKDVFLYGKPESWIVDRIKSMRGLNVPIHEKCFIANKKFFIRRKSDKSFRITNPIMIRLDMHSRRMKNKSGMFDEKESAACLFKLQDTLTSISSNNEGELFTSLVHSKYTNAKNEFEVLFIYPNPTCAKVHFEKNFKSLLQAKDLSIKRKFKLELYGAHNEKEDIALRKLLKDFSYVEPRFFGYTLHSHPIMCFKFDNDLIEKVKKSQNNSELQNKNKKVKNEEDSEPPKLDGLEFSIEKEEKKKEKKEELNKVIENTMGRPKPIKNEALEKIKSEAEKAKGRTYYNAELKEMEHSQLVSIILKKQNTIDNLYGKTYAAEYHRNEARKLRDSQRQLKRELLNLKKDMMTKSGSGNESLIISEMKKKMEKMKSQMSSLRKLFNDQQYRMIKLMKVTRSAPKVVHSSQDEDYDEKIVIRTGKKDKKVVKTSKRNNLYNELAEKLALLRKEKPNLFKTKEIVSFGKGKYHELKKKKDSESVPHFNK